MKVLVVTQYFYPENFRINDLVTAFCEENIEVDVLCGIPNYPKGEFYDGYSFKVFKEKYCGADVYRTPLIPRGNNSKLGLVLNYLSYPFIASVIAPWLLRGKKYDKIFVYGVSPIFLTIPAIVMKFIKRAPLTLWVQDLWPESASATGMIKNKYILTIIGWVTSLIYAFVDKILITSEGFENSIIRHDFTKTKIEYLPQWGEKIFEEQKLSNEVDISTIFPKGFNVVFAGNIGLAQSLDTLIKAASRLEKYSEINIVLVGDGREVQNLKSLVKDLKLEKKVFFTGSFPLEHMPTFFKSADALFLGLKGEDIFTLTVPGKIQAYMASGKPILTSATGAASHLVKKAGCGLIAESGDVDSIVKNIESLYLMDVASREELGANGLEFYNSNFKRPVVIEKLIRELSAI